jgi:hypothetical protein
LQAKEKRRSSGFVPVLKSEKFINFRAILRNSLRIPA